MPAKPLLLCGGFLGAGKTSLLLECARILSQRGYHPGLICNDQAGGLVDTGTFKDSRMPVQEVAGGCFCCKFSELTHTADKLETCDVILAEPVGSCTDLVATVIKPLQARMNDNYRILPYSVLAEPFRLKRLVSGDSSLPDTVRYLYSKQLEEAEVIVISKADQCTQGELDQIRSTLEKEYPHKVVMPISSVSREGIGAWLDWLLNKQSSGQSLEIDYQRYGQGEAELVWLNATLQIQGEFDLEIWMRQLQKNLVAKGGVPTHVKASFTKGNFCQRVHFTDGERPPEKVVQQEKGQDGVLILNARVVLQPEELQCLVRESFENPMQVLELSCFRPGQPNPAHRIA